MEKSLQAISLQAGLFLQHFRPSPSLQTSHAIFFPRLTAKQAPVPRGPRMSVSLLRGWIPFCIGPDTAPVPPKPIPFLCSSFTLIAGAIPVDWSPSSHALVLPH
jgi:hypothetical protein